MWCTFKSWLPLSRQFTTCFNNSLYFGNAYKLLKIETMFVLSVYMSTFNRHPAFAMTAKKADVTVSASRKKMSFFSIVSGAEAKKAWHVCRYQNSIPIRQAFDSIMQSASASFQTVGFRICILVERLPYKKCLTQSPIWWLYLTKYMQEGSLQPHLILHKYLKGTEPTRKTCSNPSSPILPAITRIWWSTLTSYKATPQSVSFQLWAPASLPVATLLSSYWDPQRYQW